MDAGLRVAPGASEGLRAAGASEGLRAAAASERPRRKARRAPGAEAVAGVEDFQERFGALAANVASVIKGKDDVIKLAIVAMLCEGHVLFEDLPGTGKSMLARALAGSMSAQTARVQCTPDLLPADITGASILDQARGELEFRPGPVFTNVLLADEINRASPKTQSALLEAMAERRVSADARTYELPRPFVVLATQNPVEQGGTFPLPEAQVDRFLFKLAMGYLTERAELEVMLDNALSLPIDALQPVIDTAGVLELMRFAATEIDVSEEVGLYTVRLVQATRQDAAISMGASPRATIALFRSAKVLAASDGRAEVYPDDIRFLVGPVMGHRIVLSPEAILRGETPEGALERVTASVKAPLVARR